MKNSLFSQYAPAIASFNGAVDDPSLRIAAQGALEVFYAPFDAVNPRARVLLVGITPGRTQAMNALIEAQRQLRGNASHETALMSAKRTGAFSGAMRNNLVAMLDHIGLQRWLGIASCEQLFGSAADLLQSASVLPFPVFVKGENYNGQPDPWTHVLLKEQVLSHFVPMLQAVPQAVIVPLGPVPTKVVENLTRQGLIASQRVLIGLPHPSGANAERIQYFLGCKAAEALSSKTDPRRLDAARASLQAAVATLR